MRHPLVAILATMGLLCAALCGFRPVTRNGVQCPTAPVQRVVERDCCGRLVVRAPKPGERSFVQCRCTEKKSATQHAVAAGPKFEIAPPAPFEFALPAAPPAGRTAHAYVAPASDWRIAPPTRPPALA